MYVAQGNAHYLNIDTRKKHAKKLIYIIALYFIQGVQQLLCDFTTERSYLTSNFA